MSNTISQPLSELLVRFCQETGTADFTNVYSGRGMFGKQCFGITVPRFSTLLGTIGSILNFILEESPDALLQRELLEEFGSILNKGMTDNLGTGTIMYFPGYLLSDDVPSEDIDEGEEGED